MQLHENTQFLRSLGKFVREQVELACAPLKQKIEDLEGQLAARPAIEEADVVQLTYDAVVKSLPKPENGKDAVFDVNVVRELIDLRLEAVISEQKRLGMLADYDEVASRCEQMIDRTVHGVEWPLDGQTRDYAPLRKFIQEEIAKLPKPENGKDGAPGKDAVIPWDDLNEQLSLGVEMIRKQLEEKFNISKAESINRISEYIAGIPAPKDGAPGKDSEIDYSRMTDIMKNLLPQYFEMNPVKDGKDGRDGVDGAPGKDADMDDVAKMVDTIVDAQLKHWGPPKNGVDGKDGQDGLNGVAGRDGIDGKDGLNGKDGTSVTIDDIHPLVADLVSKAVGDIPAPPSITGSIIDRAGVLSFVFSNGSTLKVGEVVGKDGKSADVDEIRGMVDEAVSALPKPKDGKDGVDGVGFEFVDFRRAEGDTTGRRYELVISNKDGTAEKVYQLIVPGHIHREMWSEEAEYEIGDCVTLGGSQWCAKVANRNSRPDTENENWILSVKRGRDGKQGPPGLAGKDGEKGRDGRDLTQISFTGAKS